MKRILRCEDCAYFCWSDILEREACHYPSDDPWPAPCEEDVDYADHYEEYEEDEERW